MSSVFFANFPDNGRARYVIKLYRSRNIPRIGGVLFWSLTNILHFAAAWISLATLGFKNIFHVMVPSILLAPALGSVSMDASTAAGPLTPYARSV